MKCRNCRYNGFLTDEDGKPYSWCEVVVDNLDVDEERECACYVPATHAEQIRAMSDEELAKKMSGLESFALTCGGGWSPEKWLEWLKREAEDD